MQQNLKEIFGNMSGLDAKSVEFLTQALEKNNLPGFDYIEFKLALERLSSLNLPVETAFRSAFATASTVGLTKEKLISTAQHYRQVLIQEKQEFDRALNNQLQKRVNSKQQEIEKLKIQIEDWKKQIEELQKKINTAQAVIDDGGNQIQAEMEKIRQTQLNFERTHQSILNQIENDIRNVQQLI